MITVFIPALADQQNTNAQMLAVKNIVASLDATKFHITMLKSGQLDSRINDRKNVTFIPVTAHGNTIRILAALLKNPPDIFFYPNKGLIEYGFLKLRKLLRLKTKIITHVVHEINHEHVVCKAFIGKVFKKTLAVSTIIAGNSTFVTKGLKDYFNINALTIYDIIDTRYFYPQPTLRFQEVIVNILYTGALQPKKRPEIIIEFAKRYPQHHFKLIGKGPQEAYCRQLSQYYNCHNVEFLGQISQQALGKEMRQADIFLFPSISEGHPQVLGQAAACGLPIIAMNCYQPDFVIHNKTGFLAANDRELYAYFETLSQHRQLRQQFAVNALKHVQSFNNQQPASQWANLFATICNR